MLWFAAGYFTVHYAIANTVRLVHLPRTTLSRVGKILNAAVNVILVFVAALFSVCLAIKPDQGMIVNTVPFICLMFSLPIVYVCHLLRVEKPSTAHVVAGVLYVVVPHVKGSFTVKVLADPGHSVAKWLTQPLDIVWLVMAVPAPFPSHTAKRQACRKETLWKRSKTSAWCSWPSHVVAAPSLRSV